jgi:hypothetical protein
MIPLHQPGPSGFPPLAPATLMPLPVAARDPGERLLLLGIRVWAARRRSDPELRARLAGLLGVAAPALLTLLEAWAEAMPYAPAIHPCCAQAVDPDEALLLELIAAAAREDETAADAQLTDLLPAPHRARLFALAGRVAWLLPSA